MHTNLLVIGAGPAGYVAALHAAQRGASVAVVERDHLGGTCLNRGCVPSKALLASAELAHHARHAAAFGVNIGGPISVDWSVVQKRKDGVLNTLRGGIAGLLKARKVERLSGSATLSAPGQVAVTGSDGATTIHTADAVIIATGSAPARLPGWPADPTLVCTSDEAVHWATLPKRLLIVGGGVIGCEFACLMQAVGVEVTIVELAPRLLATPGLDADLGTALAAVFAKRGITIKTGRTVAEAVAADGSIKARLDDGTVIEADRVLLSVGRRPNTAGLGLEALGAAQTKRGFIEVGDSLATSVAGLWAAGDVNGRCLLAHAASYQAVVAVDNALAQRDGRALGQGAALRNADAVIPGAVYTFPEIGSVGLTADEAVAKGLPIAIGRFPLGHLGKALAAGTTEGFVKIIRHRETDALLGVHVLGAHATEIIAAAGVLLHTKATAHDLAAAVIAHPTLSEGLKEAAEDSFGNALHLPPRRITALTGVLAD